MSRTWYGWNLDVWSGMHFARTIEARWATPKSIRKKKLFHPRIKLSWGGVFKPMTKMDAEYRHRWKADRRKFL